jgi:hypothetical protein
MNTVRNWWNGSSSNDAPPTTKAASPNMTGMGEANQTMEVPIFVKPVEQSSEKTIYQQKQVDLRESVDKVSETKAGYDQCEQRRMTAVINGKDAQDYSCEREFAAFKKAFDQQLYLESRMPVTSSPSIQ